MSINPDIRDQAYQFFVEEAPELLQTIESGLLALREHRDNNTVHSIMRAAHSLKGGAASVGLDAIKQIAHRLETLFKALYSDSITIDAELETHLLAAYDVLQMPLTQAIAAQPLDEAIALEAAEAILAPLEKKFDAAIRETRDFVPTSADLGFSMATSIFEVDVAEGIRRIETAMAETPENIAGELRAQAEVFVGFAELLNLPKFGAIAQAAMTAVTNHPEQAIVVAALAIADLKAGRTAILQGRPVGPPSPALIEFGASHPAPIAEDVAESTVEVPTPTSADNLAAATSGPPEAAMAELPATADFEAFPAAEGLDADREDSQIAPGLWDDLSDFLAPATEGTIETAPDITPDIAPDTALGITSNILDESVDAQPLDSEALTETPSAEQLWDIALGDAETAAEIAVDAIDAIDAMEAASIEVPIPDGEGANGTAPESLAPDPLPAPPSDDQVDTTTAPTPVNLQDETYQFFVEEAPELLNTVETGLLNLRQDGDRNTIHSIMRAAHSLKGGAASVGLAAVPAIAHRLETIFKALYSDRLTVDTELETQLLAAFDCLRLPLMAQLTTGHFDPQAALAEAESVIEPLEARCRDAIAETQDFIPSSSDLGIDMTAAIFEVDVAAGIAQLDAALTASPDAIATALREQAEVFIGFAELLNLPGFKAIAQAALDALGTHPQRITEIATLARDDFGASREAVLAGDRTGGQPSPALAQLAAAPPTGSVSPSEQDLTSPVNLASDDLAEESSDSDLLESNLLDTWGDLLTAVPDGADEAEDAIAHSTAETWEAVLDQPALESPDSPDAASSDTGFNNAGLTESTAAPDAAGDSPTAMAAPESVPAESATSAPDSTEGRPANAAAPHEDSEAGARPAEAEVEGGETETLEAENLEQPDSSPANASASDDTGPEGITLDVSTAEEAGVEEAEGAADSIEDGDRTTVADAVDQSTDDPTETASSEASDQPPAPATTAATSAAAPASRPAAAPIPTLTVRVDAERLSRMNNLLGEITISRNGLELQNTQAQGATRELHRRFERFQTAVEGIRSLSDQLLLMEQHINAAQRSTSAEVDERFDALEMDRYSALYGQTQLLLEEIVQLEEAAQDVSLFTQQAGQMLGRHRKMISQMQDELMWARMLPVGTLLNRFPRVLRDLSNRYGKPVKLALQGTDLLVDKAVLEKLYDPLLHLLRNGFDHGIESIGDRQQQNKPAEGQISVKATYRGRQVVIEVRDDGRGLDSDRIRQRALQMGLLSAGEAQQVTEEALYGLIFEPGFSTAAKVSDLSGRGVGLDVVREQVRELNGRVTVTSTPGEGTTFTLLLPLTLTMLDLLICFVGSSPLAFRSSGITEIIIPKPGQTSTSGDQRFLHWQGKTLPIYDMDSLLTYNCLLPETPPSRVLSAVPSPADWDSPMLILERDKETVVLQVDRLVTEQELVVKPFGKAITPPSYAYGCTVLGDGSLVPVMDGLVFLDTILARHQEAGVRSITEALERTLRADSQQDVVQITEAVTLLVIDDAVTSRRTLALSLERAGYRVLQARDGQEGIEQLEQNPDVQLIVCDVEMPNMNGFEFLTHRRQAPAIAHIPTVMLTSRSNDKHRWLAKQLGATDYFTKPYLEQEFLGAIATHLQAAGAELASATS